MSELRCLNCTTPMVLKVYNGIEYDECPNCNAHWFDAGELGLILQSAKLDFQDASWAQRLSLPHTCRWCETDNQGGEVQCRRCRKPLGYTCPREGRPLLIAKIADLEVDFCTKCHGLWFDGDEFNLLVGSLRQEHQHPTSIRARAEGPRPNALPEAMATPENKGLEACQQCGAAFAIPDLNWDEGLLKCDACLGPQEALDPLQDPRLTRLRERNKRRWDRSARDTVETPAWLHELANWFA